MAESRNPESPTRVLTLREYIERWADSLAKHSQNWLTTVTIERTLRAALDHPDTANEAARR